MNFRWFLVGAFVEIESNIDYTVLSILTKVNKL